MPLCHAFRSLLVFRSLSLFIRFRRGEGGSSSLRLTRSESATRHESSLSPSNNRPIPPSTEFDHHAKRKKARSMSARSGVAFEVGEKGRQQAQAPGTSACGAVYKLLLQEQFTFSSCLCQTYSCTKRLQDDTSSCMSNIAVGIMQQQRQHHHTHT